MFLQKQQLEDRLH
jgi:ilvD: dihydroxy-acid dehydratase